MTSHDADRIAARLDLLVFTVLYAGLLMHGGLLVSMPAALVMVANAVRVGRIDNRSHKPLERPSGRVDVTL